MSLTLANFPFRRLLPLFQASAATVLSGHVTPCKPLLYLRRFTPSHGTSSSRIRPRLTLSSLVSSNRGYICTRVRDDIRVVHALEIPYVLLNVMPVH
ncbi:hypothetical protein EDB89DRAFT_2020933 [Lactarius sanguifluus]|nr:hypothetical protein EDB89DRAFT_2020933 [Lactarius sanguifluus]